ncbi:MAG: hypothetical protein AAFQ82_28010, partial [Myxococcota bacterium]
MKYLILLIGASALVASCSAGDDPSLQVTAVASTETDCSVSPETDLFRSSGTFDPRVGTAFSLTPVVTNRLTPTGTNNQQLLNDSQLFAESNNLALLGFDVCYIRGDDERVGNFGSFSSGFPVDCETDGLPGEFV